MMVGCEFKLHRGMRQASIFRKYVRQLLLASFIFILITGAIGWASAHPQEEVVVANSILFHQDQVAGDTHSQPVHAHSYCSTRIRSALTIYDVDIGFTHLFNF